MKKFIDKIYIFTGIVYILVSFILSCFHDYNFENFFCGVILGVGFCFLYDGIDLFFQKRKKAADQEKTGH